MIVSWVDRTNATTRVASITYPRAPRRSSIIHGSSGEIDRQVKSILENALAVYKVDADDLRALEPDVIVTQSQCDVCAVSETDLRELIGGWLGGAPELVSLEPNHMEDVFISRFPRASLASQDPIERGVEEVGAVSSR